MLEIFINYATAKTDEERNQSTSSLLNKLMLYPTAPNVPAITYGQENEKRGWTQYENPSLREHHNCVTWNTGLHMKQELPYLGVSRHGLI